MLLGMIEFYANLNPCIIDPLIFHANLETLFKICHFQKFW